MHLLRRRHILDHFHDLVAEDHFSGGDGYVFTHLEFLGPHGRAAAGHPFPVVPEILQATGKIGAAFLERVPQDGRIGQHGIGGGKQIEKLS